MDVWLYKRQLKGGDVFNIKIKRYIRRCKFVSAESFRIRTQDHWKEYFRMEWNLAAERSLQIDESIPFIVPVVIDETSQKDARVPEQFSRLHWMWLKNGEADAEFSSHVVQLVKRRAEAASGCRSVTNVVTMSAPPLVNRENPWPGLASFDEQSAAFFLAAMTRQPNCCPDGEARGPDGALGAVWG